jgi:perosamine synthetase
MIPVNRPVVYPEDEHFVHHYLSKGWVSSESPAITDFEVSLANRFQRDFAIAVSSGTAALELAFKSLGLGPSDEVIMPSFAILSCAQAVTKLGATPVFVDSNLRDFNADVDAIEGLISKNTKAILAVHTYGLPAKIEVLEDIARKYGLFLIEDAAETIGAEVNGRPCGSFGDISIMSFYANKHITTGEGGAVLTNSTDYASKVRYFRNLCFKPERRFFHSDIGWNYRLGGLQAALGLGQIMNLEKTLVRKRLIGEIYDRLFQDLDSVWLPLNSQDSIKNCYWVYSIVLKPEVNLSASECISKLAKLGVESRPFFYPLHMQPVLKPLLKKNQIRCTNAEFLGEKGFYLPSGVGNTDEEIWTSAQKLLEVINGV